MAIELTLHELFLFITFVLFSVYLYHIILRKKLLSSQFHSNLVEEKSYRELRQAISLLMGKDVDVFLYQIEQKELRYLQNGSFVLLSYSELLQRRILHQTELDLIGNMTQNAEAICVGSSYSFRVHDEEKDTYAYYEYVLTELKESGQLYGYIMLRRDMA